MLLNQKSVVYIARVGEDLYKYGISCNVLQRFRQHQRTFPIFEPHAIYTTPFNHEVEKSFQNELKIRGVHRTLIIKDRRYRELFETTPLHPLAEADDLLRNVIQEVHKERMMELASLMDPKILLL